MAHRHSDSDNFDELERSHSHDKTEQEVRHIERSEYDAGISHVSESMLKTSGLMILLAFFIGMGGFILNFDLGYTGSVLVMKPFQKAFGHCVKAPGSKVEVCHLTATEQSLGSSIYLLFMSLGAGMSGYTCSFFGPRHAIQVGCVIIIIGAAGMLGTSGNFLAYVVCKCIGAVGIGHIQAMSSTYGVECAPPRKRGLLITLYAVGATLGNLVVSCICLGTWQLKSDWSWKIPILCQIPVAFVYGVGLFIFPESPRWLLTKEKTEMARHSFARLYNRDPAGDDISFQVREIEMALEVEKEISSTTNWTEIFHRNFIRRTFVSVAINVCGALSGAFFIFSYAAIFFEDVGVGSPIEISVIINSCLVIGCSTGPFFVEYLGRRRTIITGYSGMMTCMLIFAAVSSGVGTKSKITQDTMIAFLCLWAFMFGAFIASSQWVTSAEMHAVRHRTYAQAFVTMITNVFVFATNYWTPYMLNVKYGNMGTNVGYFYFGCEAVALALLFYYLPENARLTLEQIDEYFTSGRKAWKTSLKRNKRIAKGEITMKDD